LKEKAITYILILGDYMEQNVITTTYELVDEIKDLKEYKRFIELGKMIEKDEDVKELVHQFMKQRDKYEEAQKYGKYHPDLKQIQISFAKAKENLYTHKIVIEYKKIEKQIQEILNTISKELAQSVSNKIKHPNEVGLLPKH